jgi:hypothetical protein
MEAFNRNVTSGEHTHKDKGEKRGALVETVILFVFKLVNQNSNGKKKNKQKSGWIWLAETFPEQKISFFLGLRAKGGKKKEKKKKTYKK